MQPFHAVHSREQEPPAAAFKPQLDAILQHALGPVAIGLSLLYVALALLRPQVLAGAQLTHVHAVAILMGEQLLIAAGLLVMARLVPKWPARRSHALLMLIGAAIALDSVLHMVLVANASESITFVLALLGLAFVSTHWRWHVATMGLLLVAWLVGVVVGIVPAGVVLDQMGMFVFIASALSVILFAARRRTLLRLERLRLRAHQLNDELAQSNRELDAFAHRISHDLNTPLTTMKLQLHLLKMAAGDEPPPQLIKLERATRVMQGLVRDLLWLARADRQALRYQDVDISAAAHDILDTLQSADPERAVLTLVDDELVVSGDPGLLRVVLLNLLQNAWKFTGKQPAPVIEVHGVGPKRGGLRGGFMVRDNGAGFHPEGADRMFEAFERLHSDNEFAGTGIGLATVARIVERHGGSIRATGAPGEGATFSVSLPYELPAAAMDPDRES